MYLKDADECEVLLRLIDDCDRLVEAKSITAAAAYVVISEAARHHSDHPATKRNVLAEMYTRKPATEPPPPQPEAIPVPGVAEGIPVPEEITF